jgi:hypothetical protein
MMAMNIEVRIAAISYEKRLIRYLKEFQIDRSANRNEISCCFFLPLSSTLAFLVRSKSYQGSEKKFQFTLQSPSAGTVTKEFTISEINNEIGHLIAPNANQTGLPSTDVDAKFLDSLGDEDIIIITLQDGNNGPNLIRFKFKARKMTGKEEIIFPSDAPIRFAPQILMDRTSKKIKRKKEKKTVSSDCHGKGKRVSRSITLDECLLTFFSTA